MRIRATQASVVLLLITTCLLVPANPAPAAGNACGTFRWPVQTLSDADRRTVDLQPTPSDVATLRAETPPASVTSATPRTDGAERRVYRVRARIVSAHLQRNGDIRIVLAPRDDLRLPVAVEMHAPKCIGSAFARDQQRAARRAFLDRCGSLAPRATTPMKGIVSVTGVGFWSDQLGAGAAPNGLELNPVLSFSGECWQTDGSFVTMLAGDSVISQLENPLGQATGWRIANGAHAGCPVTGEEPVDEQGQSWTTGADCRDYVLRNQAKAMGAHPDIVLWWDRPSISHFLGFGGNLVLSGSDRFWQLRARALDDAVRRLSQDGATVVFIETEPVAFGIADFPWGNFLVNRYFDLTVQWDAMLRTYAQDHPTIASYVSITDVVCHTVASPCDDTMPNGLSARPRGMHYEGAGVTLAVDALRTQLAPIVTRLVG